MPDLVARVTGAVTRDLVVSRTGTGRLFYTARLQYLVPESTAAVDRGLRITRKSNGAHQTLPRPTRPVTGDAEHDEYELRQWRSGPRDDHRRSAARGPVSRVHRSAPRRLRADRRARSRRRRPIWASSRDHAVEGADDPRLWWRRGGFEHVEKHDDRVMAFATRLAAGRHELTYLARATTAGTFTPPGIRRSDVRAGDRGQSMPVTITVK